MLLITLKYFPISSNVAFLQIKQTEVIEIKSYLFIFYIHVCSSIFTLLAGFTQFNPNILKQFPSVHKWIGKLYVFVTLVLASPSGFFIGIFANGGFYSKISFVILSILWFYFTLKGFILIKRNNIKCHKAFMMRSFALTFSAVTLRLWKVIIVSLFHPAPMDVYQIIAWLGWVPNLLFIEYCIFKQKYK
ncbi:DUF2306 domain-containing protein [Flavobacterium sp. HJJ]|nr:DUF2306 domain-containing protein [Flavobacterium marginilacus]MBF4470694.1 DUF2306 domain-containing protein [Flavobacterium sp. HJJ]